jgi:hypothetical protein
LQGVRLEAGGQFECQRRCRRDGKRYQIKGRRFTQHNQSRQLSAIRDLDKANFDYLAGVLFAEDYSILRAAIIIPCSVIKEHASYVKRTNSHRFLLRDNICDAPGVRDVTAKLPTKVVMPKEGFRRRNNQTVAK